MTPEREPEKWLLLLRKAAGAQITQYQLDEVVTRNIGVGPHKIRNYASGMNENQKDYVRNNWRASLVPAAAVIPAPIAYVKVAAVKKLVVEQRGIRSLDQ